MKGQITKINSDNYYVSSNDKEYICKLRGKFRKDNFTFKVGDYI